MNFPANTAPTKLIDYFFLCHICGKSNNYKMIPREANVNINCMWCDNTIVLQVRNGKVIQTNPAEPFIPWTGSEEYLR